MSKNIEDDEISRKINSAIPSDQREYLGDKFYITVPWSFGYYFTIRGSENFHIYIWVAKDLAWSQDAYYPAMIFGVFALLWCAVLAANSIRVRSIDELYMLVALFLWLSANFLWMSGETFRDDDAYVVPRTGFIMESAIAWILFYHVVLRPFKIIPKDEHAAARYEENGLKPRFSYFENWRQYEHAHTLCWLGKDLSWDRLNPYFWVICLIPTVTIAADFIWTTFKTKRMMVDTVHYFTQLMWVFGNMAWALGNIFVNRDGDDSAYPMFQISEAAQKQCRYAASWILFSAYFPIVILYCIWLPLTFMGEVRPIRADDDGHRGSCSSDMGGHMTMTKSDVLNKFTIEGGVGGIESGMHTTESAVDDDDNKIELRVSHKSENHLPEQ